MKNRGSKWLKYKFMKQSDQLALHLPETKLFNELSFWSMLDEHRQIIVKPVLGSRGARVKMITRLKNGAYKFHLENKITVFDSKEDLYAFLINYIEKSGRKHLIQSRIKLATVDKRPFDIRVVVQRETPDSDWQVTGSLAKIAGKGYIVTNITRSNGNVMHLKDAILKSSLNVEASNALISEVKRVALLSTDRLGELYVDHLIFGLDMGIDINGHVWIIEANLRPSLSHFKKLGDKKMYHRVLALKNIQNA